MIRELVSAIARRYYRNSVSPRKARPTSRTPLRLERLDERDLPTVYYVTSLNQWGPGSLGQAIIDCENDTEPGQIEFAVSGRIEVVDPFPELWNILTIVCPETYSITIDREPTESGYDEDGNWYEYYDLFSTFVIPSGLSNTPELIEGILFENVQEFYTETAIAEFGAAIDNGGTLTVRRCGFYYNIVTDSGGAIFNTHVLTVEDCSFHDNIAATGSGGAIYHLPGYTGCTTTISESAFIDNTAYVNGGAVAIEGGGFGIICTDSHFSWNLAQTGAGGAIYSGAHNWAEFVDCGIYENSSSTGGGGLHINSAWFAYVDSDIAGNNATYGGLGLYVTAEPGGGLYVNINRVEDTYYIFQL